MKSINWYKENSVRVSPNEDVISTAVIEAAVATAESSIKCAQDLLESRAKEKGIDPPTLNVSVCVLPPGSGSSRMQFSVEQAAGEVVVVVPLVRVIFSHLMALLFTDVPDFDGVDDLTPEAHNIRIANDLAKFAVVGEQLIASGNFETSRVDQRAAAGRLNSVTLLKRLLGYWDDGSEKDWIAFRERIIAAKTELSSWKRGDTDSASSQLFDMLLRFPICHELSHVLRKDRLVRGQLNSKEDSGEIPNSKWRHELEINADYYALWALFSHYGLMDYEVHESELDLQDVYRSLAINYSLGLIRNASSQGIHYLAGVPRVYNEEDRLPDRYPRPDLRFSLMLADMLGKDSLRLFAGIERQFCQQIDFLALRTQLDSVRLLGSVVPAMVASSAKEIERYIQVRDLMSHVWRSILDQGRGDG